ncbi:MAG TPA: OmpH family outer membrane protein [Bacteroidia bacterium]|jgi:outer membrane protein|nr:OmpH family outer membrane protein [Bacteroidia bacterium]
MKQTSLIINIVLIAAVAVLFYMNISLKKNVEALGGATANPSDVLQTPATLAANNVNLKDAKIAYLNIDSLDYKYQYIVDNSKEYANKQMALESQLNSMAAKFQADYQDFQQAAQAGVRGEAELSKQKAQLEQQQYDAAAKQKQLENLGEEVAKKRGDMLKRVSNFIARYNNGKYDYILAYTTANISSVLYAKPGLDITKEIVDGLNTEYKTEKSSPKK